jgi:MoxR-like ATPase
MEPRDKADVPGTLAAVAHEVGKVFVGPAETVELLLVAMLARGHVLVEGVPGVAKTTLVKAFAAALGSSFRRIQFTPDLLPQDITGTHVLDLKTNEFLLRRGPVFAHVVLADEINRAPAKTQSALLEAMQEGQVTIDGDTHRLPPPFLVLATQNPIEHEGTYPLPEAQLDRFLCRLTIGYPPEGDERRVLETHGHGAEPVGQALDPADVVRLQDQAGEVHAEVEILDYILEIVRATRRHGRVALGASPRAALALLWAAKARALCRGRTFVLPDDVKALAVPVLAHRLLLQAEAEIEGLDARGVVTEAVDRVPWVRR